MDIHPFISEPPENHQPQGNEAMKVWLVEIQTAENITLGPLFETEVFSTELRARLRAEKLNKEKLGHSGYWFTFSTFRTVNAKNKDW